MKISIREFSTYRETITAALDEIGADEVLAKERRILIKPNLVNASSHPVTTAVECCEAIIEYIRACSAAEIVVAEGCGDAVLETDQIFSRLGYDELVEKYNVSLLDLNHAPLTKKHNPNCRIFPDMMLPDIAFSHYIISIPVLKAHSLATITGALKNMMGFAPPKYYSGNYGTWKKAVFHNQMHQSIDDLCCYIRPDLSVVDASIGLADFHLGGNHCNPPVNKIIAGYEAIEVDRKSALLLGIDWRDVPHLS
ncbi:MAG: DUF362 domain-containing protein [Proteobacteria bacterium]|nr:DUF362 domain-containing protein [Pseudomonadota bacterium]